MVVHDSWLDGISDGVHLERLLLIAFFASVPAFGIKLWRRGAAKGAFFSDVLFLALCPWMSCSGISFIRLLRIIRAEEDAGLWNLLEKLREAARPFWLGLGLTVFLLAVYLIGYLRQRIEEQALVAKAKG